MTVSQIDIFPWEPLFATGVPLIDTQHEQLVALLNRLATTVAFGGELDRDDVIAELFHYAEYHFSTEESYWHAHLADDDVEARHQREHHRFVTEVSQMAADVVDTTGSSPIEDLLDYLVRWLATHILVSDRRLAYLAKALADGYEPDEAQARAELALSGEHQTMVKLILSLYGSLTKNTLSLMRELATHRAMDAQLRESEEGFRTFFEQSPIAVSVRDADGRFLAVNPAAERMHGRPATWFIGYTAHELGLCGLPEAHLRDRYRSVLAGSPQTFTSTSHHGDGHPFPKEVRIAPTQWHGERAVLVMVVDRTAQEQALSALREQQRRYADILLAVDAGTWEWNVQTGACRFNARWAEIIGYSLEELAPTTIDTWLKYAHPDDLPKSQAALAAHFRGDTDAYVCEARMRHKDGHWVWVMDRGRVISRTADGAPLWVFGTHSDITARKRDEERLRQSASVFEHANEGITITDADGTILDVNAAFTRITGYTRDEAIGQNPRILKSGRHGAEFYADMWRSIANNGSWEGEIWNRRKDGTIIAELLTITAVRDPDNRPRRYVALFSDISRLKAQQRQLEFVAHYDPLTGLPNRNLVVDKLQVALLSAHAGPAFVGVAYLDLDGFKEINDQFGHDVGDRFLEAVAKRMHGVVRGTDTLGRFGGDEFIAVLSDLRDEASCLPVLERLLQAAAQPVRVDGRTLQVTVSIGVTLYPQPEQVDAEQLIRQADLAMYEAKKSGRGRYHFFDVAYDKTQRDHLETQSRIVEGLAAGEFVLYYQPKVNMRSGQVVGAEALIRWQHPEQGLLAPAAFLPAVDGRDAAITMGEWVIDQALQQISQWRTGGLELPVSVNIDGFHLQQPDFVTRIGELLGRYPEIVPGDLEFELLETSALDDMGRVREVIYQCAALGVSFALDDFGTGYSSLAHLRRLPARQLKVDRSFVRDILDDPDDLALLDGVIGLAQSFQRDVIAEGVEELEHGAHLLRLGCELAQGYVIARPMPADQIPEWVARWHTPSAWQETPQVRRDDVPMLFAITEHRRRVSLAQRAHANGDPPPQALRWPCRLAGLLAQRGDELQAVARVHDRYHALCDALLDHTTDDVSEVLAQMARLSQDLYVGVMAWITSRATTP